MLILSKQIPSRRKTFKIRQHKKDFLIYNETFREVRAMMRAPLDECYWCSEPFKDGDMMALAIPEKGKNRVLCQRCIEAATEEKEENG